jgi:hypothetical protein
MIWAILAELGASLRLCAVLHGVRDRLDGRDSDLVTRACVEARRREGAVADPNWLAASPLCL